MELHLTHETEAKLNDLAQRTSRGTDELLQEAVEHLISYNDWLEGKVRKSESAIKERGTVPHEDVRAWLDARTRR